MPETLAERLHKKAAYAKTSMFPRQSLCEVYGEVKMAYELDAITTDEFFALNTDIVRNGINNPQYFERGGRA